MRRPHVSMPLLAAALTAAGAFAVVHVFARARQVQCPRNPRRNGVRSAPGHRLPRGLQRPGGRRRYRDARPSLAPLAAGTRTHNVRMDIVAAEIEVAPGVRYQAWTFGGSVPGSGRARSRRRSCRLHDEEPQRLAGDGDRAGGRQLAISRGLARDRAAEGGAGRRADAPFDGLSRGHGGAQRQVANGPAGREHPLRVGGELSRRLSLSLRRRPVLMHMAMGQYGVVVV